MNASHSELLSPLRLARIAATAAVVFSLSLLPLLAQAPAAAPAVAAPTPAAQAAPAAQAPAPIAVPQSTAPNTAATGQNGAETSAAATTTRASFTVQEQSSEFQQIVFGSTGRTLPIFGAQLFNDVPSTFAPITDVPVSSDYVLGPGDEINVQLVGQVNQQYGFAVDRTGAINIPGIGPVQVAGMPYGQMDAFLTRQFGHLYRNFTLTSRVGALRSIQVIVVGEARRPGTYSISSLSTLLNALFASGGPTTNGTLRDIQVKREGKILVHFDLYDLLLRGDKSGDIRLASGDVIFIPFSGPQVAVAGSVRTPGIYELKGQTTVAEALALAGGPNSVANTGGARLERVYEHSMRSVEDINLATGGMQPVQNGDILSISPILERFRNAVTLRGNVASPGRYVWHQGMRLSELIPNKEALITRSYWNRRNAQGQLSLDYLPTATAGATNPVPINREGALQVRGTTEQAAATTPPSSGSQLTNGAPGTTSGNGTPGNGSSAPGALNAQTGTAASAGAVGAALTQSDTGFSAQTDVVLSAPDIDWSYAVIERLSTQDLKTSLIPFNLGRLVLNGDATQNYELQPGDIVTIFSTADVRVPVSQQTRFVRLEGEFVAPGVYSVLPGETLRGLLRRSGGFTPDAYLYASQFTRESTRRLEAQRLQEYANQLDAQISAVTASNAARAISSNDQTAAIVSANDARNAVARLRNTVPVGRIVLDLRPSSVGVDTVPDLALEDGDRFVVPRVPSNVTVEGQVYNANAFVYTPSRRMLDYLHRAGGPDREADRKREFILRADGSVISRQYADVKHALIFPGDTVVVPPILDRRSVFQRVLDITSVVSNFGFSAATLYLFTR